MTLHEWGLTLKAAVSVFMQSVYDLLEMERTVKAINRVFAILLILAIVPSILDFQRDPGMFAFAERDRVEFIQSLGNVDRVSANAVYYESRNADIDPYLVASIVFAESSFRPSVVSHAGAIGLMQVMPATGASIDPQGDLRDPRDNVRIGVAYLKKMIDRYDGDVHMALVAYNMGPTALALRGPYSSSIEYANKVLGT